jgi:uncharacterized membrane protein YeiH
VDPTIKLLVLTLDLLGTFVFALSGAVAGVRGRLDVFGVMLLSFVAATTGGILRDLFIGAVPPASISDWRYLAVSQVAGLVTLLFFPAMRRLQSPVLIFDAAGLALFAVAGAQKALAFGLNPLMAALLGMLTGVGGGMARDLLLAQIPTVLRAEIYAVAALAGAGVVATGYVFDLPSAPIALAGAGFCFGLRLFAIRRGWRLPVAGDDADASGPPAR